MRPTYDNEADVSICSSAESPLEWGHAEQRYPVARDVLWREFPHWLAPCFSKFVPRPAALVSLGRFSEAQTLRPPPRPLNGNLHLNTRPGRQWAGPALGHALLLEACHSFSAQTLVTNYTGEWDTELPKLPPERTAPVIF